MQVCSMKGKKCLFYMLPEGNIYFGKGLVTFNLSESLDSQVEYINSMYVCIQ